jgi:hypothetical protein
MSLRCAGRLVSRLSLFAVTLMALIFVGVSVAHAQQPNPTDKAAEKAEKEKAAKEKAAADKAAKEKAAADKAAEKDQKKKQEEAVRLYKEGKKLFDEGKFEEALALFQQADTTLPGAAPKLKIAECYDKLNKVPEAIAAYKAFLDSDPGEKFAAHIDPVKQRVEALEATLPSTITITVAPADAKNVSVSVDGAKLVGNKTEVPAGEHTIVVTADGFEPKTEVVTLKGNETREVTVTLAAAVKVAPPPKPKAKPKPKQEEPEERSNVPAYVTLGIAGAGIVLGTVFGIMALGAKSDFDDEPTTDNADSAERAALIADMSFGVALTFGITGAVLLFSGGGDEEAAEETSAVPTFSPYAGPKGGGVGATWKF